MTDLPPGCSLHRHLVRGDPRGKLVALQGGHEVPFDIARVYYLYDTTPDVVRGHHAHLALRQWLVCVSGSCRIILDDGHRRRDVVLDDPATGLLIDALIWREMADFSPGAVLLVLASERYDEADYIRDHDRFLALVAAKGQA